MAKLPPRKIGGLMLQVGFPVDQLATGIAIALAESGGRTTAVGGPNSDGSKDYGLWQINDVHKDMVLFPQWRNAVANTQMAKSIYDAAGGWTPWSTFNSGAYREHADAANRGAHAAVNGPSMESGLVEVTPGGVAADVAGGAVDAVKGVVGTVGDLIGALLDGHTWVRVLEVAGGGVAVLAGLYLLAESGAVPGADKLADLATTVVPAGAAAKAAGAAGAAKAVTAAA